jgi:hypothetical protein
MKRERRTTTHGRTKQARPRPPSVSEKRLKIAAAVYNAVWQNTESFELNNIGSLLAYLLGAIVTGTETDLNPHDADEGALLALLRAHLPPKHGVWRSIILPDGYIV